MPSMISTEDGQPIWLDVTFCHDCKRSLHNPNWNKDLPYYCPLWNEWMHPDDYCSKGKED